MKRFPLILLLALLFAAPALSGQPAQTSAAAADCPVFLRSFGLGYYGFSVRTLQIFLNSHGAPVAAAGPGAPGRETEYFGPLTRRALAAWQAAQGIVPASGYFGPLTRAKIAAPCAAGSGGARTGTGAESGATSTPVLSNPTPVLTAPTALPPPAATTTPVEEVINPRSIVGILCYYNLANGGIQLIKGSGVIVGPAGYVLTARHLVDPRWTLEAYAATLTTDQKNIYATAALDHCEIGLPSPGSALPTAAEISAVNPSLPITTHFQYLAGTFFVPPEANLSLNEYHTADFAVLKISGAAADCALYNPDCSTAGEFPYSPTLAAGFPGPDDQILSYGYPAEPSVNQSGANFYDFFLKGAVGTAGGVILGDQRFANQPIAFAFEANDIQGGRSGSPLFWRGRVIGLLYGNTSTSESYNLNMSTVAAILNDAGFGFVLGARS